MGNLVVKLTGKAFDDPETLRKFVSIALELIKEHRMAIVSGGGRIAREAIALARALGVTSNYWLDEVGIAAARLNALVLLSALAPHSYPRVPTSIGEALEALGSYRAVVMGGLVPGQSTSAVALEVAEALGVSEVYDLAAVDGVYDKDPRRHGDARLLKVVEASRLRRMLDAGQVPGDYALVDQRALDVALRSKIAIKVASYKNPENLIAMIRGENPGSVIEPV